MNVAWTTKSTGEAIDVNTKININKLQYALPWILDKSLVEPSSLQSSLRTSIDLDSNTLVADFTHVVVYTVSASGLQWYDVLSSTSRC